ncbi:tRNA pseudouridine(55) synthase TruB [Sphingorhabdus sp. Alg239-R122]|uniref:tRNA pseudouridine(55) synthase TruB n=1 Tax=Sphingorhabdus sp. Alg239-R122 TaxID=2305989 RepID=UPI0013D99D4F|nr:tRNA pseudouridine(55) synthase TruB [Sphingorhabdus sp. Alg239-R122]
MSEPHINGWIILDKPLELGSTQAVGAVKRNLREGGYPKTKTGHGGTLDPLATGVLPIALGEATKLAGRMLDASKIYEFTIAFGAETSTLDVEGEVTETSDVRPSPAAIVSVLSEFMGPIQQVPPKYSALKVEGKRAYDLARAGEDFALKMRTVTIYELKTTGPVSADSVTLMAHVSKGTYIRSLARDIACKLGTVGHVTMLRRIKAGPFDLSHAISLDKLNEIGKGAPLDDIILPMKAGLDDIPALDLNPEQARRLRLGQVDIGIVADDGQYWARDGEGSPVALIRLENSRTIIERGFNV